MKRSTLVGAALLTTTSAVGPGFLTQTAYFTEKLQIEFGFIILLTTIVAICAQLNKYMEGDRNIWEEGAGYSK